MRDHLESFRTQGYKVWAWGSARSGVRCKGCAELRGLKHWTRFFRWVEHSDRCIFKAWDNPVNGIVRFTQAWNAHAQGGEHDGRQATG